MMQMNQYVKKYQKLNIETASREQILIMLYDGAIQFLNKAKIAINLFTNTIAQFVAKYAVSMGGLDVVVFTGGIGENQINVRKKICKYLECMGLIIDEDKNNVRGVEVLITKPESKIKAYIIPTNEELVIARDTKNLI